jgi:hypothetical protein
MPSGFKGAGSPWFGLEEESVIKGRNDEPYSGSDSYNSVPVECNCFVLDRVY